MPDGATTGRYLVLLAEDAVDSGIKAMYQGAGVEAARVSGLEFSAAGGPMEQQTGAAVIEELGVAVVDVPPDQGAGLGAAAVGSSSILAVEPERILYALESRAPVPPPPTPPMGAAAASAPDGLSSEYLRGFRDAAARLAEAAGASEGDNGATSAAGGVAFRDSTLTWGLQATGVDQTRFTGRGVAVAVLDTGLDLGHPDFAGRTIVSESFVAGETPQDTHGHGTHCCGTSCGTATPPKGPRYGIAHDALLHVGKVLAASGSGAEGDILAGVAWALGQGCKVVSMSLGRAVAAGTPFSPIFENAAQRGLRQGTLIVAASGNDSRRDLGVVNPVSHPANCPSVMAVAAVDSALDVTYFSNGGVAGTNGGAVDIAAPGLNVLSSWPAPTLYNTISGTSMATPHVAGLAALYAEANPSAGPKELWGMITQHARLLSVPSGDVGAGLAQAP